MKKFTNILALVVALVVCVGALTACSGSPDDTTGSTSTTAPGGSISADKDEGKDEANKPGTTAPQASKPIGTTAPETSEPQQEETTTPSSSANAG